MLLCIMAGCSSEKKTQTTQVKNDEGYVVTELTTAIYEQPPVVSGGDTPVTDSISSVSSESGNGETTSSSWFDDAVFVGDSVTLKLNYYCDANPDALGNAKFFCAGSMGYGNTQMDNDDEELIQPYYKGVVQNTEDCAVVTNSTKVFVMLGMNDVGLYGVDESLDYAQKLLQKIHDKSPDAVIYVQSTTPILSGMEKESWNNTLIREFNEKLQEMSAEKGYHYLDIYSVMADENGCLREEYCSDPEAMGIHFTEEACAMWCDYLKNHV